MCARFYSTKLGRFLSADPLVVAPGDPQMLDRYAYVRNNPLRYTDRTGLCFRNPVTGEMLHCSTREAFEWTVCASSPENCRAVARNKGIDMSKYRWSEVSRMARCGIDSPEFKGSYAKYLSGASFQELEHYANPKGGGGDLMGAYYSTLKRYGFISDQDDTGNLDDIAAWLGDRGGGLVEGPPEELAERVLDHLRSRHLL